MAWCNRGIRARRKVYTDRGSHYFHTPEARGRSERAFQTHQGRLPQELARAGIKDMGSANQYLEAVYRHGHNREFGVASTLPGTAYVPFISGRPASPRSTVTPLGRRTCTRINADSGRWRL